MPLLLRLLSSLSLAAVASTAAAYSPAGHMVTGVIAYQELHVHHPLVLERLQEIMAQHPDRGNFGDARGVNLLMAMARWPDDIRHTGFDHPTWHYASKPLGKVSDTIAGSAIEAFALELSVAKDPRAPAAERAIALCWIFHLVGDMHQPLHAADRYSVDYPGGDHGGGLAYIVDPQTRKPISLHWYWDQAATRSDETPDTRAGDLMRRYPRNGFKQLATDGRVADMIGWAAESYALARSAAYRVDLAVGLSEQHAATLTPEYDANSRAIAEKQLTLAGYRLADLLDSIFR